MLHHCQSKQSRLPEAASSGKAKAGRLNGGHHIWYHDIRLIFCHHSEILEKAAWYEVLPKLQKNCNVTSCDVIIGIVQRSVAETAHWNTGFHQLGCAQKWLQIQAIRHGEAAQNTAAACISYFTWTNSTTGDLVFDTACNLLQYCDIPLKEAGRQVCNDTGKELEKNFHQKSVREWVAHWALLAIHSASESKWSYCWPAGMKPTNWNLMASQEQGIIV